MNFDTFAMVARAQLEADLAQLKKDVDANPSDFEGMTEDDWFESLVLTETL